MRTYVKALSLITLGVCVGLAIWFGLMGRNTRASQQEPRRELLSKLPTIKNCVEHVKVVKAELLMWGNSQIASIEVKNEAFVGVVSISIEQIVDKHLNSVVENGFSPDKAPLVVIAPGEMKTITIGNLGKSPIRIGSVMFSDGSEEGCNSSVKDMRQLKEFHTKKPENQK